MVLLRALAVIRYGQRSSARERGKSVAALLPHKGSRRITLLLQAQRYAVIAADVGAMDVMRYAAGMIYEAAER